MHRLHALMIIPLAVGPLVALAPSDATHAEFQQNEKRAVVHLGSYAADLASAGSAMLMAVNLQNNGADVTLFLDRDGVRLADARQPALEYAGIDVVGLLDSFVAAGGRVVLCPPGAAHAGIGRDQLRPGAEIGSPPVIAELMLGADVVIDF
jgi:sulfur relay (sulfurtransferase) complex TusBCD TusD component (DsrE family)